MFDAKEFLMEKIGFLQWARLDVEFMNEYCYEQPETIISPDVHSLHIIWKWDDGIIQHEIADYPYVDDYEEFLEWLAEEIGDDAYGDIEWTTNLDDIIENDGMGKDRGKFNPLDFVGEY